MDTLFSSFLPLIPTIYMTVVPVFSSFRVVLHWHALIGRAVAAQISHSVKGERYTLYSDKSSYLSPKYTNQSQQTFTI